MQPESSGGGGGGGGGSEPSRGAGLTRFRSAPATWLEALLDSDTENDVVLDSPPILPSSSKPPPHPHSQPLPTPPSAQAQLKQSSVGGSGSRYAADLALLDSGGATGEAPSGLSNFVRQNSSPAEFLSQISSDIFFPSFSVPPSYDYLSSPMDVAHSAKRPREADSQSPSAKLSSPLKGEQSGRLRSAGGSLDAEMEKMMEDLVPCRVRAKRGCATHPRSIAERVRRTRISDRIRKLQELVPNMDKQTNTADMLEEAVEYVKFLQKQIQELTEHQKKCTCSANEQ